MSDLKEYIVILKDASDLDNFYDDMETPGGNLYIPNRTVDLANRRPLSRSTHYYLTAQEAEQVSLDPRVQSVSEPYYNMGGKIIGLARQYSDNWNKLGTNLVNDSNWFLLRGYERTNRSNWGTDGVSTQTGFISLTNTGRNVDVVVIDGHIQLNHPEFARNPDGTGGSRINQFNWFQYNPQVRGISSGTYVYDFIGASGDINHGHNVGAIAVGNTNGWARDANIYNYWPYSGSANSYSGYLYDMINYIRVWHANKPVNPLIGRKNPTILNMSIGISRTVDLTTVNTIVYQGQSYSKPGGGWTNTDRANFGLVAGTLPNVNVMVRDDSLDADLVDAVNDGIIIVGAAGNNYMYQDSPGGVNYDNRMVAPGLTTYYMRGSSPAAATGVICVSAIDATVTERKVDFSVAGPRTDIFAAGTNIMGAYYTGGVNDPRGGGYQKGKQSGTSQASPQVCGILACAMEAYPNLTPAEALTYIKTYANQNILTGGGTFSTTYGAADYLSYNRLYNGPNQYAMYRQERIETDQVYPKKDFKFRPTSGLTYPRSKLRRSG